MYTIFDYQIDARNCINDILGRGKTPILVGGSGLYIRAALYDYKLDFEDIKLDFSDLTNEELLNRCLSIDPKCNIHLNNRKRLERFLNLKLKLSLFFINKLTDFCNSSTFIFCLMMKLPQILLIGKFSKNCSV